MKTRKFTLIKVYLLIKIFQEKIFVIFAQKKTQEM